MILVPETLDISPVREVFEDEQARLLLFRADFLTEEALGGHEFPFVAFGEFVELALAVVRLMD